MKTTWMDVAKKQVEIRVYERGPHNSRFGRSFFYCDCPFCNQEVMCYLWALSGSGKRCSCGALLGSMGQAYKRREK